jgi:two-component system, NarL family, nitrate/nitrite response regulator NarL
MKKVQVYLSDWQSIFREGIHLALCSEECYEVVGEATTSEEALEFIEDNQPGVAILNADHGELTGIEVTHRVKRSLPSVSMILMMDRDNCEQIIAALKGGASACLSKDIEPDELLDAVNRAVHGEYPIIKQILNPAVAKRILSEFENLPENCMESSSKLPVHLLPLEELVLRDIASGKLLEDLLRDRKITEDTVRQCLYIIRGKLMANSHIDNAV